MKDVKTIAALLIWAICLNLAACCPKDQMGSGSDPLGMEGSVSALWTKDGKLVDDKGKPVTLRGVSTHGIGWFPQYINANAFLSVKKNGGNVIRAAMYTDTDTGYLHDPHTSMLLMEQAVENAVALDMYVIADWHILSDGDPNAHLAEAITFFDALASKYRDCPNLIYEICNEPNGVDWEAIKNYAYAIVPVIRQYSAKALIIVGTPGYSYDIEIASKDPLPMEGIMYSFHYYTGEKERFDGLDEAVKSGLPVFVSEWGMGLDKDGNHALDEGREFAKMLNEKGLSWCAWSLCNKDECYSLLSPDCTKLGAFTEDDLSDAGLVVWDAMRP